MSSHLQHIIKRCTQNYKVQHKTKQPDTVLKLLNENAILGGKLAPELVGFVLKKELASSSEKAPRPHESPEYAPEMRLLSVEA